MKTGRGADPHIRHGKEAAALSAPSATNNRDGALKSVLCPRTGKRSGRLVFAYLPRRFGISAGSGFSRIF